MEQTNHFSAAIKLPMVQLGRLSSQSSLKGSFDARDAWILSLQNKDQAGLYHAIKKPQSAPNFTGYINSDSDKWLSMPICQMTMKLRDSRELREVGFEHFWVNYTLLFLLNSAKFLPLKAANVLPSKGL